MTKLKQLDADYTTSLKEAKQKSFVTQHAAFGYLALDYGLIQVPIAGLSPEEEPSSGRLAELKEYVKKIRSIIFTLKRMLMIKSQKLWPMKLG